MCSRCSDESEHMLTGIEPVKRFEPRSSSISDVIVPILEGNVPLISFSLISSEFKRLKLAICDGIVPDSPRLRRSIAIKLA
jgi:hypothetical protein